MVDRPSVKLCIQTADSFVIDGPMEDEERYLSRQGLEKQDCSLRRRWTRKIGSGKENSASYGKDERKGHIIHHYDADKDRLFFKII